MMKNTFYFVSKALFVFKAFKFLSWVFGHIEQNGLIRKIRLISKCGENKEILSFSPENLIMS